MNGQATEAAEKSTVRDLLLFYRLEPEGIIVELNERVIPGDRWAETMLCDGDRLELVSLVGGG
jgi:sulfur carrier protein